MMVAPPSATSSANDSHTRHTEFQMPLFKPGTRVMKGGRSETVSHVVLRRRELMVYLKGHDDPVKPETLDLAPLWFTTVRRPEVLHWYL